MLLRRTIEKLWRAKFFLTKSDFLRANVQRNPNKKARKLRALIKYKLGKKLGNNLVQGIFHDAFRAVFF